jgi:hypothetical protein
MNMLRIVCLSIALFCAGYVCWYRTEKSMFFNRVNGKSQLGM